MLESLQQTENHSVNLHNFITNEEYVSEEHDRQVQQGILPFYFTKVEFNADEKIEYETKLR